MLNYEDYQEIKHLEETDKEAYVMLNKLLDNFLKTASAGCHDIRNHIAAVSSYAQILALKEPELTKLPAYQNMRNSINNLVALMDSISTYRYTYRREEKSDCNLKEIIDTSIKKITDKFPDFNNSINFTTNGNCAEYPIVCCREQLITAICNVLENATEASIYNPAVILISLSQTESFYEITIVDNGHGLSEEMLDNCLTPFKTDKSGHFGLGLSTAANILYMHNGNLVISNTEHGAKVAISIPK